MSTRLLIHLNRASFAPAFQLATTAMTAAAMGEEVKVFLTLQALVQWGRNRFGKPESTEEESMSLRALSMGIPEPMAMLQEARKLGVRLVTCPSMLEICGYSERESLGLDAVESLPEIWRFGQTGRILSLG